MKKNNFEKLDLSFLPKDLAKETRNRLEKALNGLKKIRWPIKAVVLGGGYKHKELTFNEKGIGSDIDLFIFSNFIPFFWKKLKEIQDEINKDKFFFHYRGVIPLFLGKSRTFWAYKLKKEGIVLKGDKDILKKIRAQENNIPKIEAIRILFQTLVVWLKLTELVSPEKKISSFMILRSYLNIGESYLTFFGCLKPSYCQRMEEFQKESKEFGLEGEVKKKIILGYLTKVNPPQAKIGSQNTHLSLIEAKKDCLWTINHLLSLYLKTKETLSLDKKLDILAKEVSVRPLFNFAFFWFLRNLREIKPKFFPIVFRLKITDLWKIVVFKETNEKEKLFKILRKYFKAQKFSDETLTQIFESHPTIATIEIN